MDLGWTPSEQAFRAEVRAWLEANVPQVPLPSGDSAEGFALHVAWEKKLFAERLSVVSWPEEYGGRGASLMEWLIFEEEYYRAGAPNRVTQNGIFLLAPTLFEYGTDAQKTRILPRMAAAEELWAQAWSEPGAGSDLAGVSAKARKVETGWRLSGQKTWCTRASFCTHVFGLFRSDPEAQRHRGLTYFMVPLDVEGVTVRGFGRLDGDEGFAEIFFDDAFVPHEAIIGAENQGWKVAMTTASSERGLTLRSPGRFLATASRLVDLHRARGAEAPAALRDRVAQAHIEAQAYRIATFGVATKIADGVSLGAESSLNKLFWSEMDVRTHETALDLLGDDALVDNHWTKGFQFALAGPIYAGTNEIQRNVVARRLLGLPRG